MIQYVCCPPPRSPPLLESGYLWIHSRSRAGLKRFQWCWEIASQVLNHLAPLTVMRSCKKVGRGWTRPPRDRAGETGQSRDWRRESGFIEERQSVGDLTRERGRVRERERERERESVRADGGHPDGAHFRVFG